MEMSAMDSLDEREIKVVAELASRGGRSLQEVADACGIQRRQLYRMRKRPAIKRAIRELVLDEVDEALPDAIDALRKQATRGNVKAAELLAKMSGMLIERQMIHSHHTGDGNAGNGRFSDMSESQIDAELEALEIDAPKVVDEQ